MWEVLSIPSLLWWFIGQTLFDVATVVYVASHHTECFKLQKRIVALHKIVHQHVTWARAANQEALSHTTLTNSRLRALDLRVVDLYQKWRSIWQ